MWKKFKIEEKEYQIKHSATDTTHRVTVTDFICLWYEEITNEDLLIRCKGMNRLVEATDQVLLRNTLSLLETETDNVTRNFTDAEQKTVLHLETCLDGFKFRIKFFLTPASNLQIYEQLTCPLLTVITDLEKRHQLLVDLIKKKDLEILEYKLEGGKISRKAVETEQFVADVFSLQCTGGLADVMSCVAARPSHALTPLVQDLLQHISSLPLTSNIIEEETAKETTKHKPLVKLKSPSRKKKLKLYDDDEDDDNHDCINDAEAKHCVNKTEDARNEVGKSVEVVLNPEQNTRKLKSRVQNVLPNL